MEYVFRFIGGVIAFLLLSLFAFFIGGITLQKMGYQHDRENEFKSWFKALIVGWLLLIFVVGPFIAFIADGN